MRNMLALILLALLPLFASCAMLDATGSNEVEHLLDYLKNSNCQEEEESGNWLQSELVQYRKERVAKK